MSKPLGQFVLWNVVPIAVAFWSGLTPALAQEKAADATAADSDVEFRKDVQYGTGDGEPLLLNLALPNDRKAATAGVIFIHGGGWSGGRRETFDNLAREAAERGYVAATITYRLAPKHPFPAQIEDAKCAVRWIRAHAEELNVDPDRIGAVGASAGAHLAMMLGAMGADDGFEGRGGWDDQSSQVQAVVSFAGPTDLTVAFPKASTEILFNFIGGPIEAEGEMYRNASPLNYINRRDARMLLFHGTDDEIVPVEQAFRMANALTRAGIRGRVELIVGAGHGWGGDEMDDSQRAMWAFLEKWLAE